MLHTLLLRASLSLTRAACVVERRALVRGVNHRGTRVLASIFA